MDFLSDQLFDGRKIRILTIVDAFSKISPAIDVRFRYTGADVVTTLERVARRVWRSSHDPSGQWSRIRLARS